MCGTKKRGLYRTWRPGSTKTEIIIIMYSKSKFGRRTFAEIYLELQGLHWGGGDVAGGAGDVCRQKTKKELFMTPIPSTSDRLHSEFVRLLFLQIHRETDRFFCSFRSSVIAIRTWPVPLRPRGVLLPPRGVLTAPPKQSWSGSCQGSRLTYQLKYWWGAYRI